MADREYEPIIRERIVRNISRGDATSTTKTVSAKSKLAKDKEEREAIVLWKQPIKAIYNAAREIFTLILCVIKKLQDRYIAVLSSGIFVLSLYYLYITDGPHSAFIKNSEDQIIWGLWWIWLGVLSSVGLGTGLHTFLLFLGPHIAKVTMAAYECGTTDFVGYPEEFNCPEDSTDEMISMWTIMVKVRFPAMCWGAGTALGELPPYFMARAARLSGVQDEDDEDLKEFQELLETHKNGDAPQNLDIMTRGKLFMHDLVQRVGFFGILGAASIPNPLFDLAGITCGHFLVPFWTFFGATLIGKAIVKMHIQKIFIIFLFSKHHVDHLLSIIKNIPFIGEQITSPIEQAFEKQRAKLTAASGSDDDGNVIGWIFEKFVLVMVAYFVVTIVNSLAQARIGRIQKEAREKKDMK